MTTLPLVELVQVGFLGFAVAMMLMAFVALKKLMTLDMPQARLALMSKTTIAFLGGSLLAICLGIVYAIVQPEVNIVFDVNPPKVAKDFEVRVSGVPLNFPDQIEAAIQDGREVTIDLSRLTDRVEDLERRGQNLEKTVAQLNDKIEAQEAQRQAEVRAKLEAAAPKSLLNVESGY